MLTLELGTTTQIVFTNSQNDSVVFKNKEHLRTFLWQASLLSSVVRAARGLYSFPGRKEVICNLHAFTWFPMHVCCQQGHLAHKELSGGDVCLINPAAMVLITHSPLLSLLGDFHPKTLLHSLHEAPNTLPIWRSFHYLLVTAHGDWNVFSWHKALYWKFREWSVSVLQWLRRKHLWKREKASSKKYRRIISGPVPRNSLSVRSCILSQLWLICLC